MRYSIDHYDNEGFLKAPLLIWIGWMLLARAWVVFAMAGVSREHGPDILKIVYPDTNTLYLGLAMGVPSMIIMWLMGLRKPQRRLINWLTQYGRQTTIIVVAAQLAQTLYHVHLQNGKFNWPDGVTILLLLWFLIYLFNGRWARDCFVVPDFPKEALQDDKGDDKAQVNDKAQAKEKPQEKVDNKAESKSS